MKKGTFFVAIVLLLIFSGCVSAPPPQETPTPTAIPIRTTPTPAISTPTALTPSPSATPSVPPAINVTSYPQSVNSDTNFTIKWEVSGGAPGNTSTAVLWGYKNGGTNISDYPKASKSQTGRTPAVFSADLKVPAGGNFYLRIHAVVDGVDIYSNEYQITIIPPPQGGGGGGY